MNRKEPEHITVHIKARFICDESLYSGTVTDISEKSMCINTSMPTLFSPADEMLITLKEEVINIPVKIKRIIMEDSITDKMDVEVINPSREYLDFVGSFRPSP
jgi:hypothetical protein